MFDDIFGAYAMRTSALDDAIKDLAANPNRDDPEVQTAILSRYHVLDASRDELDYIVKGVNKRIS